MSYTKENARLSLETNGFERAGREPWTEMRDALIITAGQFLQQIIFVTPDLRTEETEHKLNWPSDEVLGYLEDEAMQIIQYRKIISEDLATLADKNALKRMITEMHNSGQRGVYVRTDPSVA